MILTKGPWGNGNLRVGNSNHDLDQGDIGKSWEDETANTTLTKGPEGNGSLRGGNSNHDLDQRANGEVVI